jgi:2-methylaconitate cis-trans-isomerase PrpF
MTITTAAGSTLNLQESGDICLQGTETAATSITLNYAFSAQGGTGKFAHTVGTGNLVKEIHPENGAGPANIDVLVSIHGHLDM